MEINTSLASPEFALSEILFRSFCLGVFAICFLPGQGQGPGIGVRRYTHFGDDA